jgi:enterobacteria phage integrase
LNAGAIAMGASGFIFAAAKAHGFPLRGEVGSDDFHRTYIAALENHGSLKLERGTTNLPGTIAALIVSYQKSTAHLSLRQTTKRGYKTRLEILRVDHGHRTVKGLTRERIEDGILKPYFDRPGAALSLLKMLRILIRHAMSLDRGNLLKLEHDPSIGIKRPKTKEIRAWTDDEIAAFEERWPIGTRERAAYALMLYAGAARADVHRITWRHVSEIDVRYTEARLALACI